MVRADRRNDFMINIRISYVVEMGFHHENIPM